MGGLTRHLEGGVGDVAALGDDLAELCGGALNLVVGLWLVPFPYHPAGRGEADIGLGQDGREAVDFE